MKEKSNYCWWKADFPPTATPQGVQPGGSLCWRWHCHNKKTTSCLWVMIYHWGGLFIFWKYFRENKIVIDHLNSLGSGMGYKSHLPLTTKPWHPRVLRTAQNTKDAEGSIEAERCWCNNTLWEVFFFFRCFQMQLIPLMVWEGRWNTISCYERMALLPTSIHRVVHALSLLSGEGWALLKPELSKI